MPAHTNEPRLDGIRVLVVDDNEDIRSLLKVALEDCGAIVAIAGSAREALERLAQFEPQVIVTDLAMPGDDGYWLLNEVRSREPEHRTIPLIALTAGDDRRRALDAGFLAFLQKPPALDELCYAIIGGAGVSGKSTRA